MFLVERGQIKILDFGLAKLVSHATEASTTGGMTRDRTAVGITLGTVAYMSPEQVTGEDLDARTDLFSLGVVLYEAITGQQPFTGKTSAVIFSAILTRAPVAPIVFNPEVPLRLQEVINNCLEKDRELRYQDAAGLRADLKRLRRDLESGQSGVFRISGSAPVGAWEHTHATAPHAAAPGSGATHRSPGSGSAPIETVAPSPAATSRKSNAPLIGAILVATAAVLGTAVWITSRSDAPSPSTEPASPSTSSRTPLALATASLQSKDYRAALQYADEAIRLAPDDRDAIRIRDAARASLARFDEAVALANQRIVAADPNGATNALETARAIDPTAPALNDLATRIAQLRRTQETASQEVASARPSPPPTPRPQPRAKRSPAIAGGYWSRPVGGTTASGRYAAGHSTVAARTTASGAPGARAGTAARDGHTATRGAAPHAAATRSGAGASSTAAARSRTSESTGTGASRAGARPRWGNRRRGDPSHRRDLRARHRE